jgi:hypothetical protein
MIKFILLFSIASYLLGEPIHSSISTYHENKTFTNSVQKKEGYVYGLGADIYHNYAKYKLAYEHGFTNTKQPPLERDLETDKLFLRYAYELSDNFEVNFNYIYIINDNIAITDSGKIYGIGCTYNMNKLLSFNFTQFQSDYKDFNTYQSDFRVDFKTKIKDVKVKLSSITKYINIDEKNINSFTMNAQDNYVTTGIKLHSHYKTYHLGAGAYFGKRAFAIMGDGFKIQHHSMEFDRTYAIGFGKDIAGFVLCFQYIYQRATELPAQNNNVKISTVRLIANYRFLV